MRLPSTSLATDFGQLKANYAPVEDPSVDEDASNRNDFVEDLAGMTHVSPRAVVRFAMSASPSATPISHDAIWSAYTAVVPAIGRTSAGVYTVTWPTTFTDGMGKVHSVSLRYAYSFNIEFVSAPGTTVTSGAVMTSANVATVRVFTNGTAADFTANATLLVG